MLAAAVQAETGETVTLAWVDGASTGDEPRSAAAAQGIELAVVTLPAARRGFVLLPRRWVIERSFGWMNRFRRLARDHERLAAVLEGVHLIAFAMLMLTQAQPVLRLL